MVHARNVGWGEGGTETTAGRQQRAFEHLLTRRLEPALTPDAQVNDLKLKELSGDMGEELTLVLEQLKRQSADFALSSKRTAVLSDLRGQVGGGSVCREARR